MRKKRFLAMFFVMAALLAGCVDTSTQQEREEEQNATEMTQHLNELEEDRDDVEAVQETENATETEAATETETTTVTEAPTTMATEAPTNPPKADNGDKLEDDRGGEELSEDRD